MKVLKSYSLEVSGEFPVLRMEWSEDVIVRQPLYVLGRETSAWHNVVQIKTWTEEKVNPTEADVRVAEFIFEDQWRNL